MAVVIVFGVDVVGGERVCREKRRGSGLQSRGFGADVEGVRLCFFGLSILFFGDPGMSWYSCMQRNGRGRPTFRQNERATAFKLRSAQHLPLRRVRHEEETETK